MTYKNMAPTEADAKWFVTFQVASHTSLALAMKYRRACLPKSASATLIFALNYQVWHEPRNRLAGPPHRRAV